MVDAEVIVRRLRELDRRLGLLEELRGQVDEAAYLDDIAVRAQVERHLQLAIQAAIDIAMHVLAVDTARLPEDYGSAFVLLGEEGLLDPDVAAALRDAAGMRNVLVHGYVEIDDATVWHSLDRLDDLRQFAAAVLRHVDATDATP